MHTNKSLRLIFLLMTVLSQTVVTAQLVFGTYEKAGTIGPGRVELSTQYSHAFTVGYGGSGSVSNNFGMRAGLGLSKNVDLKFRYERLFPTGIDEGKNGSFNYFSMIPKVALVPNKLSLFVPFSLYNFRESYQGYGTIKTKLYSFAPHLVYTYTAASNQFDLSTTANADFVWDPHDEDFNPYLWAGVNLGVGFSSNLKRWALRPEAGLKLRPGLPNLLWQMGLSFQLTLPTRKDE